MARFRIEGMRELQKSIRRLGGVPQRAVTPAARKGMNVALKSAKGSAPVDTDELRNGMKLVGESSRTRGKKVYRLVFDRSKNDVFQKKNDAGQITGYYPVSQEYGYFAKNGRYIPGFHFVEKSLTSNAHKIEKVIVQEMTKRIDRELGR